MTSSVSSCVPLAGALIGATVELAGYLPVFGREGMMGATVAVFTSTRSLRTLDAVAKKFGVKRFGLPINYDDLKTLLDFSARRPTT